MRKILLFIPNMIIALSCVFAAACGVNKIFEKHPESDKKIMRRLSAFALFEMFKLK